VLALDAIARAHADKGLQVALRIDLQSQRIELTSKQGQVFGSQRLPTNASIAEAIFQNSEKTGKYFEIHYLNGVCPTYALHFEHADTKKAWLLVCGLSGESYRLPDEGGSNVVNRLFDQIGNVAR
jgi:hypothetical protein